MSSDREDVRHIMLDVADNIRREPDVRARAVLVDEFIRVALRQATDLRDGTCYDLVRGPVTPLDGLGLPRWVQRRTVYARRWAERQGLPQDWVRGRPPLPGPSEYIEIRIPD